SRPGLAAIRRVNRRPGWLPSEAREITPHGFRHGPGQVSRHGAGPDRGWASRPQPALASLRATSAGAHGSLPGRRKALAGVPRASGRGRGSSEVRHHRVRPVLALRRARAWLSAPRVHELRARAPRRASCKRRGFCPSCLGRRMTDSALHLTESVFPKVMARQWVCSLPWGLRALLGYDRRLCSLVLRAFTEEVQRSLKRRAKKVLGLIGVALAHTAGITFIQRFDSALRLNVHFHSLFLDGAYIEQSDGSLEFCELAEPTPEQVADVARRTARRVADALRKAGKSLTPEFDTDHE